MANMRPISLGDNPSAQPINTDLANNPTLLEQNIDRVRSEEDNSTVDRQAQFQNLDSFTRRQGEKEKEKEELKNHLYQFKNNPTDLIIIISLFNKLHLTYLEQTDIISHECLENIKTYINQPNSDPTIDMYFNLFKECQAVLVNNDDPYSNRNKIFTEKTGVILTNTKNSFYEIRDKILSVEQGNEKNITLSKSQILVLSICTEINSSDFSPQTGLNIKDKSTTFLDQQEIDTATAIAQSLQTDNIANNVINHPNNCNHSYGQLNQTDLSSNDQAQACGFSNNVDKITSKSNKILQQNNKQPESFLCLTLSTKNSEVNKALIHILNLIVKQSYKLINETFKQLMTDIQALTQLNCQIDSINYIVKMNEKEQSVPIEYYLMFENIYSAIKKLIKEKPQIKQYLSTTKQDLKNIRNSSPDMSMEMIYKLSCQSNFIFRVLPYLTQKKYNRTNI